MIRRDELEEAAVVKGIQLRNAEKDYLIDVCLHAISGFRNALVFKGGTALYKFHNLNRFSEDIDLTINKRRFDTKGMFDRVVRNCGFIGINGQIDILDDHGKAANAVLTFRGPLYDGSKNSMVRMAFNLSSRERPQNVEMEFYTSAYQELPGFELYVLAPSEMLAEKVRAVMTREKPRDVYDLWFLLRKGVAYDPALVEKKLRVVKETFTEEGFSACLMRKKKMWKGELSGLIIGGLPEFDGVVGGILERMGMEG
jgi:predicted nucleotidyltransferase component of viral defense system